MYLRCFCREPAVQLAVSDSGMVAGTFKPTDMRPILFYRTAEEAAHFHAALGGFWDVARIWRGVATPTRPRPVQPRLASFFEGRLAPGSAARRKRTFGLSVRSRWQCQGSRDKLLDCKTTNIALWVHVGKRSDDVGQTFAFRLFVIQPNHPSRLDLRPSALVGIVNGPQAVCVGNRAERHRLPRRKELTARMLNRKDPASCADGVRF
jgi:hypothetical protein